MLAGAGRDDHAGWGLIPSGGRPTTCEVYGQPLGLALPEIGGGLPRQFLTRDNRGCGAHCWRIFSAAAP